VPQVTTWLTSKNLGKYAAELIEQGFDTMEAMSCVEVEDLERINMAVGHRKLLLRLIDSLPLLGAPPDVERLRESSAEASRSTLSSSDGASSSTSPIVTAGTARASVGARRPPPSGGRPRAHTSDTSIALPNSALDTSQDAGLPRCACARNVFCFCLCC
jgi:hypothetical protein